MLGADELVVDLFAGGGGTSEAFEESIGRPPHVAINHDPKALAMHARNHPDTLHLCCDIFEADPKEVCNGRPVGALWASPDCTHHSKAKGSKPRSSKRRALADVVIRWAMDVRPRVLFLENVEEFKDWGPLDAEGYPIKERAGEDFDRWVSELRALGYVVEWRELRACDYGAPTTRRRLFLVARCDGAPIAWPSPTHGPGRIAYRAAAECIEWDVPCPSIFDRRKPLADATLRRIARGIRKYVIESADPFVVPLTHGRDDRVHSIREPLRTVTCAHRGELALVAPTLVQTGQGERQGQAPRCLDLGAPLGTVVACGGRHALVAAFLAKHYGGHEGSGSSLTKPIDTITTQDHHALVAAFLLKYYGTSTGAPADAPMPTICAGAEHLALVTVRGERCAIADIGMRMLTPRELFRAQGFPDSYVIDLEHAGRRLSKTDQIRMVGNSVSPPVAAAVIAANVGERKAVAA